MTDLGAGKIFQACVIQTTVCVLSVRFRCACRLWNLTPDNLSAIHKNARKHVPSLREFLNPVVEEMDPEEGIEEQYKVP